MTSDPVVVNPALDALAFLQGKWTVRVSNADFPDEGVTLEGTMVGSWLAGRALLMLQSVIADGPPTSVQVIGRNETISDYQILYADARGVSRVYSCTFDGENWTQHREDPGFHQRFDGQVSPDRNRIVASWSKSSDDGCTWNHDFDIEYRRT